MNDVPKILASFVGIRAVVSVGLVVAALSGPALVARGAGVNRIAQAAPSPASGSSAPSPLPREAVDTLKALDTMLARGPGTQEYVDGVRDAKVRVDKYLESEAARDAALRDAVRAAFRYHELVARRRQGWGEEVDRRGGGDRAGRPDAGPRVALPSGTLSRALRVVAQGAASESSPVASFPFVAM